MRTTAGRLRAPRRCDRRVGARLRRRSAQHGDGGADDLAVPDMTARDMTPPTSCSPTDPMTDGTSCAAPGGCPTEPSASTSAARAAAIRRARRTPSARATACAIRSRAPTAAPARACLPGNAPGTRCGRDSSGAPFGNVFCGQLSACVNADVALHVPLLQLQLRHAGATARRRRRCLPLMDGSGNPIGNVCAYNSGPNGNKDLGQACGDSDVCKTRPAVRRRLRARSATAPAPPARPARARRSTIRPAARSSATSANSAAAPSPYRAGFRLDRAGAQPRLVRPAAVRLERHDAAHGGARRRARARRRRRAERARAGGDDDGDAASATARAIARDGGVDAAARRGSGGALRAHRRRRAARLRARGTASGASCAHRRRTKTSSRCSSPPTARGR